MSKSRLADPINQEIGRLEGLIEEYPDTLIAACATLRVAYLMAIVPIVEAVDTCWLKLECRALGEQ